MEILIQYENHSETYKAVKDALAIHKEFQNNELTYLEIEKLGGGWVAEEALSISLLCALHCPTNFEKGVLLSINHGGDSDSTGSITGNLLGLMLGTDSIPSRWKEKLLYRKIVEEVAADLYLCIHNSDCNEDWDWWEKYRGN